MLIQLGIANFKSFRATQTFSMVASSGRESPGNLVTGPRFDMIKSAAVYGHNASGKTNFLDAIYAIGSVIIGSGRGDIPKNVPRMVPFHLDPDLRNQACSFEIELLLGGTTYRYKLKATHQRIVYESLDHRGAGHRDRWARLFDRPDPESGELPNVTPRFAPKASQRDTLRDTTVAERSLIGAAASINVEHARNVFDWFDKQLFFYKLHIDVERQESLLAELADRLDSDPEFKSQFLPIIADADFGVVDAKTVTHSDRKQLELFEEMSQALRETMKRFDIELSNIQAPLARGLRLTHRNVKDGIDAELNFGAESSGTRRFMALIYAFMRHTGDGKPGTLIIDELDSSLSPDLVQRFLLLAHSPRFNSTGTQIIFSTHDRSLMDVPELLRRDQIWLATKQEDGATELYSMADFGSQIKPFGPKSRQFSIGRFGGVAEFGPLLEDIPRSPDPQPLLFGND